MGDPPPESSVNCEKKPVPTKFFGIYIPPEDYVNTGEKSCVVSDFRELNAILKRNPHSRFIAAETEAEALFLAQESSETPVTCTAEAGDAVTQDKDSSPKKQTKRRGRLSLSALDSISKPDKKSNGDVKRLVGEERDTRFPSPKVQELCLLAREITANKTSSMIAKVKANPRMLITESDVPTTLQEGCRYNALHIAAKCNNKEALAFVIDTVSSMEYMKLLYPKDSLLTIKDRIKQVVNCYLNTPDKMANETPLHFACKFLCVGAVEVLVSHPGCIPNVKNLYGETPKKIIGSRVSSESEGFNEKKAAILKLLTDTYIVPIWRDPMAVLHPVVGEVACLRNLGDRIPTHFLQHFPNMELSSLGPCDKGLYPREKYNKGRGSVFEDEVAWEIKAYGGPTSLDLAHQLHADLRLTCGRAYLTTGTPAPPPVLYDSHNRPVITKDRQSLQRHVDTEEEILSPQCTPPRNKTIGSPASPFQYSPMVNYLKTVGSPISPGPKEILMRRMDPEKGLERLARKFCVQLGIKWNEEWSFLKFFGDVLSDEGLDTLESFLLKVEYTRKDASGKLKTTSNTGGSYSANGRGDDGKIADKFSDLYVFDSPYYEGTHALSPYNSFDEVISRLSTMKINSEGFPTPTKITECNNKECQLPGRFCNCKNVVPSLYFSQKSDNSFYESSPSSREERDSFEGFELNESGDSFYRSPVTNPIQMGIRRLDEVPRSVQNSFQSIDDSASLDKTALSGDSFNSLLDEDSVEGRWYSAASSLQDNLAFFDCCDEAIYLNGNEPCKQDFQLYSLIKDDEDKLSDVKHLLVFQWFNTMKALGDGQLNKLVTAAENPSSSRRNREFPTYHSTPKKLVL